MIFSFRIAVMAILCGYAMSSAQVRTSAQKGETVADPGSRAREHHRARRLDPAGKRFELSTLRGASVFIGPRVDVGGPIPLVVHFHGPAWLIEQHVADHLPDAVLITVQLGAGSGVYGRTFADQKLFTDLADEAALSVGAKRGWSSVTVTAFSAGYGAVRAILRHEPHFREVDAVLLLDGIHAGYAPDGSVLPGDVDSFLAFAREAASGRKRFVITHSQIHPGNYASTTECVNELMRELGIPRRLSFGAEGTGMRRTSYAAKGKFRVFGYAGETAADHVDHIHSMPHWFDHLGVK